MNLKMNAGLFEVGNGKERNEKVLHDLEKLLSLMKEYKEIPVVKEEFQISITKLEVLVKNMKKRK